jgi:DNA-directed RNA polymerase specialized sigma24 family protein
MEQQYDEESAPLTTEEIDRAKYSAVRSTRSKFYGYVEWEDLMQVAELALLETPQKFARLAEEGNYTGVWQEFNRKCAQYAHKQKAAALGYKPEDLFFYSKKVLREIIPVILESWESGDLYEFEYTDRALWVDVDRALKGLSASELQIIRWAFQDDDDTVADRLGISEGAASMRVSRLLDKIREGLGGENPAPRRRSLSNAASQAQTRNQWDGEG